MHRSEPSTHPRRRPRLLLAALVTAVAAAGTTLAVTAPALAAEPDPIAPGALASTAAVAPWNVTGSSATAPLPGNLAALPTASIAAPGLTLTVSGDNVRMREAAAPAGCLGANTEPGFTAECETSTATVSFGHPVINPVLVVASGVSNVGTDGSTHCAKYWKDVTFSAIDGAPAGTRIHPAAPLNAAQTSFADNRVSVVPSYLAATPCSPVSLGYSYLQVDGLVSSVDLTLTILAGITLDTDGSPLPDPTEPANAAYLGASLWESDLAVTKTGPATAAAASPLTWQLEVTNRAGADSHGFVVHDAVPAGVTAPGIVSSPAGCSLTGNDLICSSAPPGWTATQNATVSTLADLSGGDPAAAIPAVLAAGATFGPIVLTGTAPAASATVTNTATVSGTDVDPDPASNASTVTTDVTAAPAIALTKTGALAPGSTGREGDIVDYAFTIANTGDVPLTGVVISDPLIDPSAVEYAWPGAPGTLAPGEQATGTATYALTAADVEAGSVVNTATATGTDPGGATVTADSSVTIDIPAIVVPPVDPPAPPAVTPPVAAPPVAATPSVLASTGSDVFWLTIVLGLSTIALLLGGLALRLILLAAARRRAGSVS